MWQSRCAKNGEWWYYISPDIVADRIVDSIPEKLKK